VTFQGHLRYKQKVTVLMVTDKAFETLRRVSYSVDPKITPKHEALGELGLITNSSLKYKVGYMDRSYSTLRI
jgi:hypothetical protein